MNNFLLAQPLTIRLQYKITHKTTNKEDPGVIPEEVTVVMPATIDGKPNPVRKNLLEMVQGLPTAEPVRINHILPKFLKVTNRGTAKPYELMKPIPGKETTTIRKNVFPNMILNCR